MPRARSSVAAAAALFATAITAALAEPQQPPRSALDDRGIGLVAEALIDAVGGRAAGDTLGSNLLGLVALEGTLDTGRAGLWDGGSFALTLHGSFGRNPSSFVGDLQGTDNIEAPEELRVYEAWYGHAFGDDRVELRFGVQDLNASFNVVDNGALFVNSSFGITPELAQTEPSIFPRTGLGVFARYRGTGRAYLLAGAYNAVAGERLEEQLRVRRGDGLFLGVEGGLIDPNRGLKAGLGVWHSDRHFVDFAATPRRRNGGLYVIAERTFRRRDGARILPFVQLGWADGDRNRLARYHAAGAQIEGWSRARPADRFGVAVARAVNGDRYLDAADGRTRAETAIELTYAVELAPGITFQPDLQLVLDPDTDAAARDAWVATLRVVLGPFD